MSQTHTAQTESLQNLTPGERVAGHFVIEHLLGTGGMGVVYQAWDEDLERSVALKFLRPDLLSEQLRVRLAREARTLAALKHERIVTLYTREEHAGQPVLVLELISPRCSLGDKLRLGALPLLEVLEISGQILHALAHAHAQGVYHLDLSPSNVLLLSGDGTEAEPRLKVKILDFGIGVLLREEKSATGTEYPWFNPEYCSPEQRAGRPLDGRSDLYSLALLIWKMLVGNTRISLPSLVTDASLRDPTLQRAETPPWLRALVLQGLEPDPESRGGTAREWLKRLEPQVAVLRRSARLEAVTQAADSVFQAGGAGTAGSAPATTGWEAASDRSIPVSEVTCAGLGPHTDTRAETDVTMRSARSPGGGRAALWRPAAAVAVVLLVAAGLAIPRQEPLPSPSSAPTEPSPGLDAQGLPQSPVLLTSEIVASRDDFCGSSTRAPGARGPSDREEGESACRGRRGGGSAAPANFAGAARVELSPVRSLPQSPVQSPVLSPVQPPRPRGGDAMPEESLPRTALSAESSPPTSRAPPGGSVEEVGNAAVIPVGLASQEARDAFAVLEVQLYRIEGRREVPVEKGGLLRTGDEVFFRAKSSQESKIWVLQCRADGSLTRWRSTDRVDAAVLDGIRLHAHQEVEVPDGFSFRIDDDPGLESFTFILHPATGNEATADDAHLREIRRVTSCREEHQRVAGQGSSPEPQGNADEGMSPSGLQSPHATRSEPTSRLATAAFRPVGLALRGSELVPRSREAPVRFQSDAAGSVTQTVSYRHE